MYHVLCSILPDFKVKDNVRTLKKHCFHKLSKIHILLNFVLPKLLA